VRPWREEVRKFCGAIEGPAAPLPVIEGVQAFEAGPCRHRLTSGGGDLESEGCGRRREGAKEADIAATSSTFIVNPRYHGGQGKAWLLLTSIHAKASLPLSERWNLEFNGILWQ
jgi:hypothetical protein